MKRSWARNLFTRPTSPIRKTKRRAPLTLELLEDRAVPATFTVLNTLDTGAGSLRNAVASANANSGADTIVFDSGVFSTAQTITLTSGEIAFTDTASSTVTGPGANLLSVSGNHASRVFFVNASASGSLSGMTLTAGLVNGALVTAGSAGAAVYNAGTLDMTNVTVSGNSSNGGGGGGFGGAVHSQGDTTLTNCTISNNTGNGVNSGNGSGTLAVISCTISGNTLSGLQAGGGRARVIDTTISGNSRQGVNSYVTQLAMTNCTVSGNSFSGGGAGLSIGLGSAALTNCTITGNTATGNGGGILLRGTATLTNCTISGNSAAGIGGGLYVFTGTPTFANSIVAGNTATTRGPDVGGSTNPQPVTSLGNNLIGKTDGSTGWVGSDLTGTGASPLSPQLAALASNSGSTQTMALLPTSPAINAGSSTLAPSEVQDVTVSGSAGTFTLAFNGQTTSSLAFNAAAGTVQTALNALSSIGGVGGSVTVTKSSNVFRVVFGGSLANQNLAQLTTAGSGGATATVLTVVNGNTDQRGLTRFGNTDIGAFEYQFKVTTTADSVTGSFRQALLNANASTGADTVVFTSLFNTAQTITLTGGTLTLTDAAGATILAPGAALSIGGNAITNDGPLAFDTSNSITVDSAIGGTGSLTKAGAGTLRLTGANTYTGGTTISTGTVTASNNTALGTGAVTMSGGTLSAGATVDLANNVAFTASTTSTLTASGQNLTLSGNLSGSGNVNKTGGASVILGGDNSGFTGTVNNTQSHLFFSSSSAGSAAAAWVISGTGDFLGIASYAPGITVQLGSLSSTGAGRLWNDAPSSTATFVVGALNTSTTYAGTIVNGIGTTDLTKVGTGTLTLTGANTYSGTTTISGGTLQIGAGGTTGSLGTGAVTDNASLVFNRSNALTVANVISGSGSLTKSGTGTTTLTSDNTYTGTTTISAGTLRVGNGGTTGSLGTGAVSNNATLTYNRSDSIDITNSISGSGTLNLTSTAGAITQSTAIAATTVVASATTGITLTDAGNAIASFNATNSTSGAISLTNTSTILTVTGITQSGTGAGSDVTINQTGALSVTSAISTTAAANGDIGLTSTGGMTIAAGVTAGGSGDVTLIANQAGTTSGNFLGINVSGGSAVVQSATGNVLLQGTGGNTGGSNYGVAIQAGGKVQTTSAGGSVTITGIGGSGSSDSNFGVLVNNSTSLVTSGGGNVSVTGMGGGSGTSRFNYGVQLFQGGTITAGGSGTVTVDGTGGATTGIKNYGVFVNFGTNSTITSSGGNVSVIGHGGGTGGSSENTGVYVFQGQITAGGGGTVSVNGTGGDIGGTGNNNWGIEVSGIGGNIGTITSNDGDVSLDGQTTGTQIGIFINSNGRVLAPGSNTVAMTSNSTSINNSVSSTSGAINISATGTISGGTVSTTGTLTTSSGTGTTLTANVGSFNATNTTSGNISLTNTATTLSVTGLGEVSFGTVTINNTGALTYSALDGNYNLNSTSSGPTTFTGAVGGTTSLRGVTVTASDVTAGNITMTTGLTINNTGTASNVAGVISGIAGLTKQGTGTVTLSGANTYASTTTISAGTLIVTNAAGLGSTSAGTTISSGATLDVQANIGTEAITVAGVGVGGNGALITSTGTGTVGGTVTMTAASTIGGAGSLTVSGVVGGAFALTKAGAGTTTLTAVNTYTGTTTISAGTLQVGPTGSLGTGAVIDNATLTYNRSNSINATNAISGSGTLILTSTGGAITQSAAITVASVVASAATGITLTNAGDAIGNLTANGGSGGIDVSTTSALTVNQATADGNIVFTTIDIAAAGQDLTIAGDVTSNAGSILLRGGDNVTVQTGAALRALGSGATITVYGDFGNADLGVGTVVVLSSTPATYPTDVLVVGNTDDDTFDLSAWTGTATVDGIDNAAGSNQVLGGPVFAFVLTPPNVILLRDPPYGAITQVNIGKIDLTIPDFTDRTINAAALTQDISIRDPGNGNVVVQLGSGQNFVEKNAPAGGGSTGTTHEYVTGPGATTFDIGPGSDVTINTSLSAFASNNVLKFTKATAAVTYDVGAINQTQILDSFGNTLTVLDTANRIIPTVVGSRFDDTLTAASNSTLFGGGSGVLGDTVSVSRTFTQNVTIQGTKFASVNITGDDSTDIGVFGDEFTDVGIFGDRTQGVAFHGTLFGSFRLNGDENTDVGIFGDEFDDVGIFGDRNTGVSFHGTTFGSVNFFGDENTDVGVFGDEFDDIGIFGDENTDIAFFGDRFTGSIQVGLDATSTAAASREIQRVSFTGDEFDDIGIFGDEVTDVGFFGDTFHGSVDIGTSGAQGISFGGTGGARATFVGAFAITGDDNTDIGVFGDEFSDLGIFGDDNTDVGVFGDDFTDVGIFGDRNSGLTFTGRYFAGADVQLSGGVAHYAALITGSFNANIRFTADEDTGLGLFGDFDGDIGIFGDDNTDVGFFGDEFDDAGIFGDRNTSLDFHGRVFGAVGITGDETADVGFFGDEFDDVGIFGDDDTDIAFFGDRFTGVVQVGLAATSTSAASHGIQRVSFTGDEFADVGLFGDEVTDIGFFGDTFHGLVQIGTSGAQGIRFGGAGTTRATFAGAIAITGDENADIGFFGDEFDDIGLFGDDNTDIGFFGDDFTDVGVFGDRNSGLTFTGKHFAGADLTLADGTVARYAALITGGHNAGIRFTADEDTGLGLFGDFDGDIGIFGDDNTDVGFFGDEFDDIGIFGDRNTSLDFHGRVFGAVGITGDENTDIGVFGDEFDDIGIFGDDDTDIAFFGDRFTGVIQVGLAGTQTRDASQGIQRITFTGDEFDDIGIFGDDTTDIGFFGDTFHGLVQIGTTGAQHITIAGDIALARARLFAGPVVITGDDNTDIAIFGDEFSDIGIFGDDNTDIGIFGDIFNAGVVIGGHRNGAIPQGRTSLTPHGISVHGTTFNGVLGITGDEVTDIGFFGDTFHGPFLLNGDNVSHVTYNARFTGGAFTINGDHASYVSYSAGSLGGLLIINGDNASHITYAVDTAATPNFPAGGVLELFGDNASDIVFLGGRGDDSFLILGNAATGITFTGNAGNDALVSTGDQVTGINFDGGAGNDTATLGGQGIGGVLAGGAGSDTYVFVGAVQGDLEVQDDSTQAADSLDFSSFTPTGLPAGSGVTIDLARSSSQEIGGLQLQLSSSTAIRNVVGSAYSDTISGNDLGNVLLSADQPDDRTGTSTWDGRVQVVLLDFDTYHDLIPENVLPEHVYTQTERDAIQARIEANYEPFNRAFGTYDAAGNPVHVPFVFTQDAAEAEQLGGGAYTTLYFNRTPPTTGGPGGEASEVDFRNTNLNDFASIQVNGILGNPNQPEDTTDNWIKLSAKIAAHELGHTLGLRHQDSFGPIGYGIHTPPGPAAYAPDYTGPSAAFETFNHLMGSGDSVGSNRFIDVGSDLFFGARESIKLSFALSGTVRAETTSPHGAVDSSAQTIVLAPLTVPNAELRGINAGKDYQVGAVAVHGHIDLVNGASESDVYAFQGRAGDLINIDVSSSSLARYADSFIDPVVRVYDAAGNLVAYYGTVAVNDDQFEPNDSSIVDLRLPSDGTYYIKIDTFSPDQTGDYELFVYRFSASSPTTAGDYIDGRGGDDVLKGRGGNDTLLGGTGVNVIQGGGGSDKVVLSGSIVLNAASNQTAFEGASTSFALGNFTEAAPGPWTVDVNWGDSGSLDPFLVSAQGALPFASHTYADDGIYTVTVKVTDQQGGYDRQTFQVTVSNVAPTPSIVAIGAVRVEGTAIAVTGSATDPAGSHDTLTFSWQVFKNGSTTAYAQGVGVNLTGYSFTPDDNGSYKIVLTASDEDGGSTSADSTITVANVAPTPGIVSIGAARVEGTAIAVTGSATDPAGANDTLTFAWAVYKDGSATAFVTGGDSTAFSFTPDDNGSYEVRLTVSDEDGGSTTASQTVAVANAAPAPSIVSIGTPRVEGTAIAVAGSATDAAGSHDTLTFAWAVYKDGSAAPFATGGNSTAFSFTPDDNGSYRIALTVSDEDGGSATVSQTVAVANVAPAPSIVSIGAARVEGTAIAVAGSATDPAGSHDTLTFSWQVFKNGSTTAYAQAAGLNLTGYSFTPDDNGSYEIKVTVSDGDGDSASVSQTITIANVAPTATINGAPASSPEGTAISLTSTVTDPGDVDTAAGVTRTWSVLKNGTAYATGSGSSFTFTPDDNGAYTVTLTATDKDSGADTRSSTVTVNNVAPSALALSLSASTINVGESTTLGGSFLDPGVLDTHTLVINWGDGSATTTVNLGAGVLSLGGIGHQYVTAQPNNPAYTISVTMTDKDGAQTTGSTNVVVGTSIYVLNPTASGALSLSGYSSIEISGLVAVRSSSTSALKTSGDTVISAAAIRVVGGVQSSGGTFNHLPTTGVSSFSDPLAGLAAPTSTGLVARGAVNLSGSASLTIDPGIYTSIKLSNTAHLTLNPGLYALAGGGLAVSGSASITGNGVMLYNAGSNFPGTGGSFGGLTLSGTGSINLSPMTSGPYAGILIFQARDNTRAISLSGSALVIQGGMIYAPQALLAVSGSGVLRSSLVVSTLQMSSNAASTLAVEGSGLNQVNTAGQLLAGDLVIYVDNSTGALSAEALARIDAAIDVLNIVINPHAVVISQTTDITQATTVLQAAETSVLGGMIDGVLGLEYEGHVTIIDGWDWYTGADAGAVGANQYDLQSIVTHELGHALGLGHSTDAGSVMAATLGIGEAHRGLTEADLAIPDVSGGPCGLHIGGWTPPVTMAAAQPAGTSTFALNAPPIGWSLLSLLGGDMLPWLGGDFFPDSNSGGSARLALGDNDMLVAGFGAGLHGHTAQDTALTDAVFGNGPGHAGAGDVDDFPFNVDDVFTTRSARSNWPSS